MEMLGLTPRPAGEQYLAVGLGMSGDPSGWAEICGRKGKKKEEGKSFLEYQSFTYHFSQYNVGEGDW